jgi:hypothetical protein
MPEISLNLGKNMVIMADGKLDCKK